MNLLTPLLAAGIELNGGIIAAGGGLIVFAGIAIWTWSLASKAAAMKFQMTAEGLRIDAPIYGKVIPKSVLKLSEASIVNVKESPELRPGMRTNGIGLPGARIGWFRLKNGSKGLLYLHKTDTAVCIPTTEGYTLMLGKADTPPETILRSIQG